MDNSKNMEKPTIKVPETLIDGNPIYCHTEYTFKSGGKLHTFKKGKFYTIKRVVPFGDEFIVIYFDNRHTEIFSLRENSKFIAISNYYENYFYDFQKSREIKLTQIDKKNEN